MQGATSTATPQLKSLPKKEKETVKPARPPRLPPSSSDCPIPKKPEKKVDMKPPATVTRSTSLRPRQASDAALKPSGTFNRTPSLPRMRTTASAKAEPEASEPSPDTTRRTPVVSSSQAAEICFDDNEAEIEVLQARLLQWNFINAKATQAFEEQKHQVEAQFKTVYSHIIGLKYELNQSKDMLHSFDSKEKLEKVIATQMNLLNQINSRVEDFKENYLSLAAAAQATSEIMPVSGVFLEDMGLLYQEIRACDTAMQSILNGHEEQITKTTEMAQTIHNLWKNMQEIIAELNECNDLFKELSDIQKVESSHMLESILRA
ncbi:hypothetical protein K493DRAFT_334628 [Basidiobolus meristosporus CBS 931.73]|uniref:Uncharacterized protein n=1 Tax=Basidiobolus meristosporus CBS 931.73 TaxID=1314790 RepID=A0A1Y1YWV1_9FUNG|nr:hypothetical protein K493DRAFT_334628 [Basidiobolus meristosporus CBS 931.73]|eukprot:ORY02406.1 hypothetical protein K493DRAFT_334628 [Basidiobolus meristosporus CBS 931.73]